MHWLLLLLLLPWVLLWMLNLVGGQMMRPLLLWWYEGWSLLMCKVLGVLWGVLRVVQEGMLLGRPPKWYGVLGPLHLTWVHARGRWSGGTWRWWGHMGRVRGGPPRGPHARKGVGGAIRWEAMHHTCISTRWQPGET